MVGPHRPRGLNLASGPHADQADPTWVNVDQHSLPHWPRPPHVRANIHALPFPDATFTTAYIGHVLEHVEWAELPTLGAELRRVLTPDAEVMIVGPALDLAEQTSQPRWLLDDITEDPNRDGSGMTHAWTATVPLTLHAVSLLGLRHIRQVPVSTVTRPWPNPNCAPWQVAVSAHA